MLLSLAGCTKAERRNHESKPKSAAQVRAEHRAWIAKVERHIDRHWALPAGPQPYVDGFYCKAKVGMSPAGKVQGVWLERPCGSSPLDTSLVGAVHAADPLPLPDDPAWIEAPLALLFTKMATPGPRTRELGDVLNGFRARAADFRNLFERSSRGETGRVLVQLTIAPEGRVTACEIVTTDFTSAEYNAAVLELVASVTFAARDVEPFTLPNYPLNFVWQ